MRRSKSQARRLRGELSEPSSERTDTVLPVFGGFVARVAHALVPADHVHTLTVSAQPVAQLTLVYIWREQHKHQMLV